MRLAYYILACYTLLLSCIPCQDVDVASFPAHEVSFITSPSNAPAGAVVDLCSPFCICACCSGITLQQTIAVLPDVPFFVFPDEQSVVLPHSTNSGALSSVWQPPRM